MKTKSKSATVTKRGRTAAKDTIDAFRKPGRKNGLTAALLKSRRDDAGRCLKIKGDSFWADMNSHPFFKNAPKDLSANVDKYLYGEQG